MNKKDLLHALASLHAPQDSYCVGNDKDEALCIVENYGRWSVYYSERGQRTEDQSFDSEEAACDVFLNRLRKMLHI